MRLVVRWLDAGERIDTILESLRLTGAERARCHHLFVGVVRHFARIDRSLARLLTHPPRLVTRAVLSVTAFELIETAGEADRDGHVAKIVHHAVEQAKSLASQGEAKLVNAVVRKLALGFASGAPAANAPVEALAEYYSHPAWLIRAWQAQFGAVATRALLEWNQLASPVRGRWRIPEEPVPPFLKSTPWENFYEVVPGHWSEVEPLLKNGKLYLQAAGTRLAVGLLDPKAGENILDLCAAPGGKSLMIGDAMKTGRLVSVDLPGARIERLKENLSRTRGVDVSLIEADLLKNLTTSLRERLLPERYDGVLIDVPCSNTGVMQHRADVKWRLQPADFRKHPRQQFELLEAASTFVAPGGRLVYSTCSIDTEENAHVVQDFLRSPAGAAFTLETSVTSYPWVNPHDGAGAFRLRRK